MKKILSIVLVALLVVACFVGCGSGVKGNKYVYKDIEMEMDTKGLSKEEKEELEEMKEELAVIFEKEFEDFSIKFTGDKLAVMSYGDEEKEI